MGGRAPGGVGGSCGDTERGPRPKPASATFSQIAMAHQRLQKRLHAQLLKVVAKERVPLRPDRIEPRAQKRRPKSYPWLQEPRSTLKARLAA